MLQAVNERRTRPLPDVWQPYTKDWADLRPVFPNLFSTTAHFLGTAHQTAHCTYFIYQTCILCMICRPLLYMYAFYTHLFILNDNVTFIQYTEHSLIITSSM